MTIKLNQQAEQETQQYKLQQVAFTAGLLYRTV